MLALRKDATMLGYEIIEADEAGDEIRWSAKYTARVLADHGFTLHEYSAQPASDYNAADVLHWLGY